MDLGEIQLEVAKHLQTPSLLACVLVSKYWNSIFIPELYRHLEFIHSSQWVFPRQGTLPDLATSLYRFRFHIRSLRLELLALQIDRLLCNIETPLPSSTEGTILEPLTTGTSREGILKIPPLPLFPHLKTLALNIYDSKGAELTWVAHCPQLRSLHLIVPTMGKSRKTVPQSKIVPLSNILALPLWSTTLDHLQISGGTMDHGLEAQILNHCTALRALVISPQQSGQQVLENLAGLFKSLRHLELSERIVYPWVLQPILGSFAGLERLFLSKFSVYGVFGVVPWPGEPSDAFSTEWACTRLKFLHIDNLMWCSTADTNTGLLAQWARLEELETLEIMTMGCDDRSVAVLHHFPIETPWNLDPCEVPLPWMKEMWPRLTRYKSGGWNKRDLETQKRAIEPRWMPAYLRIPFVDTRGHHRIQDFPSPRPFICSRSRSQRLPAS